MQERKGALEPLASFLLNLNIENKLWYLEPIACFSLVQVSFGQILQKRKVNMQENPLNPVTKRFPKLERDIKTEILIVGGGITGILCSYFLERDGYKTVVVEMDEIGSGASGASSGILYYGSGMNLIPSIELWGKEKAHFIWKETAQSIKEIVDLAEKNNIDCGLRKPGAIMASNTEEDSLLIEKEQKELLKLGISHSILSPKEIKQFYTGQEFLSGLHFQNCAQIYPAVFASGVAEKFGLKIFENTKVLGFENKNSIIKVKTSGGKISCEKLIFATNDFPVPPEKSLGLEKHFTQESSVIFASQKVSSKDMEKFFPKEKILWTMEKEYDIIYPHEERLILELYKFSDVDKKLPVYYPGFDFKKELQWGSSWGRTKDWLPIAGKIQKGVFTATATGDQGTTMGYTIAKHIIDMIEGKKNRFLDMCSPTRF